ncbi:MAG TPA: vWA domain-containing protein [Candidatus Angelobacter sp.]|nr:vWA domain-containing protein [Candidatus Angelobacter sp.]
MAALVFAGAGLASAQTCWVYTDNSPAKAPIKCVAKSDLTTPCAWPTDCTTVPAPAGSQTIREMHEKWHACFGATGGVTPPAGRSARWYAFHRQFTFDFNAWRRALPISPIESLEWCPGMVEPIGTAPSGTTSPPGCGPTLSATFGGSPATPRPAGKHCPECVAFPQCLFRPGGGPAACPSAPSSSCQAPPPPAPVGTFVSFPYTSLDQFQNADEISKLMDNYFHGIMHVATADADCPSCYNHDSFTSKCSPRDPMFWRLHQALDDVVRAWQDQKAVDVVLVIDRSGSMSQPDSGGGTKLQAALNAVDNFADLMDTNRTDGQVNRLGVVSYSDNATIDMAMTNVDTHLRDPGGPLKTAIANITATGATGCTAIAKGLQKAVDILCPGGTCSGFTSPAGTNARKAILVMTDGVENVPPCLQPSGASGGTCGNQCFGPQFNYDNLAFTQLVSVGFGSGADLNGPLLTLLAERQGGIYMQNPNTPGNDLKDFFAKAFAELSSEFLLVDPKGTLPASQPATKPFKYSGCGDSMLTFTSGWNVPVTPGDLTLIVDSPNGDLVLAGDPAVQSSRQHLWHFSRVRLPYRGVVSGTWRGQIIRPHHLYVNGFVTDAFADPKAGTALVRREIHRLCPQGCKRVLYYEQGRRTAQSVYLDALNRDKQAGSIGAVTTAATDLEFTSALKPSTWDLIVYAQMGKDERRSYDPLLSRLLCQGQRAIITDTRVRSRGIIFECTGVRPAEPDNWTAIVASGNLVDRALKLVNHGYPVFTYGLTGGSIQALSNAQVGAVGAKINDGKDQKWFADILGNSLGKLSPHNREVKWKTGEEPIAEVRMLPSYVRRGGWDKVNARVEVEYPTIGVGTLLARKGLGDSRTIDQDRIDARTVALSGITIPTAKTTFPLYDDGTHGDLYPRNFYWTAELTGLGKTDGPYKLRYMFDLTAGGCTTHRELMQSFYMDTGVDPKSSKVSPGAPAQVANGWRKFDVAITPAGSAGNLLGPGRNTLATCAPKDSCRVDAKPVDAGGGLYKIAIEVAPNMASVHLDAFDAAFHIPTICPKCPTLTAMKIEPAAVLNNQKAEGTITLSAPAPETPDGGAVIFLSSNDRTVASVPESVLVPAGKSTVTFPVTVYHVHGAAEKVTITAAYGSEVRKGSLTVSNRPNEKNVRSASASHRHGDD